MIKLIRWILKPDKIADVRDSEPDKKQLNKLSYKTTLAWNIEHYQIKTKHSKKVAVISIRAFYHQNGTAMENKALCWRFNEILWPADQTLDFMT